MQYWLMKTEPSVFSIEDLARAPRSTTSWDGVRNFQARNMLRDQMKKGDQVFLYTAQYLRSITIAEFGNEHTDRKGLALAQ